VNDVVDKIRKLLAVADADSGATDGERDAAMLAATRLMARHQIDEAAVRAAGDGPARPPGIVAVDLGSYDRLRWWEYDLAYVIGRVVTVDAIYVEDPPGVRNTTLVGREEAVAYVRLLHGWLVPQLMTDAQIVVDAEAGYRRLRGDFSTALEGLTLDDLLRPGGIVVPGVGVRRRSAMTLDDYLAVYRESFYRGACLRVGERLEAIHAAEVGAIGTDLVLSDRAALRDYYGPDAPDVVDDSAKRAEDVEALSTGYAVGDRVDLDPSNKVDAGAPRQLGR
jgi:hypothetical protein